MTATVCKWLDEWEDRLWRMTRGVFHFLRWLPEWIIRVLLETVGPAVVRAMLEAYEQQVQREAARLCRPSRN